MKSDTLYPINPKTNILKLHTWQKYSQKQMWSDFNAQMQNVKHFISTESVHQLQSNRRWKHGHSHYFHLWLLQCTYYHTSSDSAFTVDLMTHRDTSINWSQQITPTCSRMLSCSLEPPASATYRQPLLLSETSTLSSHTTTDVWPVYVIIITNNWSKTHSHSSCLIS